MTPQPKRVKPLPKGTPAQAGSPDPGRHDPGYELDEVVLAETPEQLKALADKTRTTILDLLNERAATTSQLAEVLGKPKGTVGYHLNVLEQHGLVRVVRTRKVRAMTEKYYGRTGRTIVFAGPAGSKDPFQVFHEVMAEAVVIDGDPLPMWTVRHIRIPQERAVEFTERIVELAEEFISMPRSGDTVYALLAGIYPTTQPGLPDEELDE